MREKVFSSSFITEWTYRHSSHAGQCIDGITSVASLNPNVHENRATIMQMLYCRRGLDVADSSRLDNAFDQGFSRDSDGND